MPRKREKFILKLSFWENNNMNSSCFLWLDTLSPAPFQMTSDRLYYLSEDLFLPLNKLQNPGSPWRSGTGPRISVVGRYQDCYDFYFLLDSVITAAPQFHFNTIQFLGGEKFFKIEKAVKIVH